MIYSTKFGTLPSEKTLALNICRGAINRPGTASTLIPRLEQQNYVKHLRRYYKAEYTKVVPLKHYLLQ